MSFATVATALTLPSKETLGQAFSADQRPITTTDGGIDALIARIDAERSPKKVVPKKLVPKGPSNDEWIDCVRTIRAITHTPHPMPVSIVRSPAEFAATVQYAPGELVIMIHTTARPMVHRPGDPTEIVTVDWEAMAHVPGFPGKGPGAVWRIDSRSKGQTPVKHRVVLAAADRHDPQKRHDARLAAAQRAVADAKVVAERKMYDLIVHAAARQKKKQTAERLASQPLRRIPPAR